MLLKRKFHSIFSVLAHCKKASNGNWSLRSQPRIYALSIWTSCWCNGLHTMYPVSSVRRWKLCRIYVPSTRLLHPAAVSCQSYTTNSTHSDTELSEIEYGELADETLDSLTELFEDLPEVMTCNPEYDVTFGSGVLTVKLSDSAGTYVINKQTPNKQIWLSSPTTGPKRYDYINGCWIYKHDGVPLHSLLTEEISSVLGQHVDFSKCSHSGS